MDDSRLTVEQELMALIRTLGDDQLRHMLDLMVCEFDAKNDLEQQLKEVSALTRTLREEYGEAAILDLQTAMGEMREGRSWLRGK